MEADILQEKDEEFLVFISESSLYSVLEVDAIKSEQSINHLQSCSKVPGHFPCY